MASDSQINANRDNASHSTGPKTPEGKQRSSLNATKFGLIGRTAMLPGEDLEVFAAFLQEWIAELKPVGIKETEYVRSIVDCKWRLNRIRSSEDGVYTLDRNRYSDKIDTGQTRTDIVLASALTAGQKAKTLDSISRHEARISREFSQAMQALEATQAARKAVEQSSAKRPSPSSSTTKCSTSLLIRKNLGSNCRIRNRTGRPPRRFPGTRKNRAGVRL